MDLFSYVIGRKGGFGRDVASTIMGRKSGGGGKVEIVPWSTGTDEQIVAMIQAAHNGDIDLQTDGGWAVGDKRTISVGAFTAYNGKSISAQSGEIVISSFNDYMNCGCVMQFDFSKPLSGGKGRINNNSDGNRYANSEFVTITVPAMITTIVTVNSKLALRSEYEYFGACTYSYDGEYDINGQTDYWKDDANKWYAREGFSGGDMIWTRSPKAGESSWVARRCGWGNNQNIAPSWNNNGDYYLLPFGCI